jgi:hypothetical protein
MDWNYGAIPPEVVKLLKQVDTDGFYQAFWEESWPVFPEHACFYSLGDSEDVYYLGMLLSSTDEHSSRIVWDEADIALEFKKVRETFTSLGVEVKVQMFLETYRS